jgi:hypothetical protein
MTGVLAGYEDAAAADRRSCRRLVGTSAGSVVAASLVAGRSPRRLGAGQGGATDAIGVGGAGVVTNQRRRGARGRGDRVLLLEPTAVLAGGALRAAARLEAVALKTRGATVQIVTPDDSARRLMGRLMDPDRGGRVLAAGDRQGLAFGR